MKNSFTCTNLSYVGTGVRYISNKKQLSNLEDKTVLLRCYIDDFFNAMSEFCNVKDKVLRFYVIIDEDVYIDGYDSIYDILVDIEKYKNNIFNIDLILSSKVSANNFMKLLDFIKLCNGKININFELENLNFFSVEQLSLLKSNNVNSRVEVKQSLYEKHALGYECNNVFTIESLLEVKKEIKKIANLVLNLKNDIAKIMFIYKYLGKKIKYDNKTYNDSISNVLSKDYYENIIYNVLINKKGICSGIAGVFKIIALEVGIECQVVSSFNHAWNVVKIGEYWYHLDLTFDLDNIKNENSLQYFLKSDSAITSKDYCHQFDEDYCDDSEKAHRSISKRLYIK
jgi:hypothetical protein